MAHKICIIIILSLSRNYGSADNLCFDFAKHGRPKVPIRKLSLYK